MDYAKDIVAAMEPFTMTLGGCDITGKISNKNGDGSFIRESKQIIHNTITSKFQAPAHDNAKFIGDREEESDWSWSGWRIYVCIAGVLAGVLIVGSIIFYLCYRRRQNIANRDAALQAGTSTTDLTTATSKLSTTNASQVSSNTTMAAPLPALKTQSTVGQQAVPQPANVGQEAAPEQRAAPPLPVQAQESKSTERDHTGELIVQNMERQAREKEAEEKKEKEEREKREKEKQTPRAKKTSSNDKLSRGSNTSKGSKSSKGSNKKKRTKKEASKVSNGSNVSNASKSSKGSTSSKGSKKHKKKDGKLKAAEEGGAVAKKSTENQPGTSKEGDGTKNQDEASVLKLDKTKSEHSVMGDLEADPAQNVAKQDVREEPRQEPREEAREAAPPPEENPGSWEWPNTAPTEADKQYVREHFTGDYKELLAYSKRHPVSQETLNALGPWYYETTKASEDHAAKQNPAFNTDCQFFVFIKMLADERGLKWPPTLAPYTGLGIVGFGLCGFAFFILTAEIVVENVRRNYNGKCNKFNVDLETDDESLSIKMDYAKDIVAAMEPFTMTLGGCDITGKISNKNGDGSFIRESKQIIHNTITSKFQAPAHVFRQRSSFQDAKIFTPTEKADYSHFIYIFIAIVVVALVVKLLAIVCWYCRKRRARARNQEPNASKPTINANLGTEAQAPNVA
ncbi:hypothetical protein M3Y96_00987700 [Aphelenchoides besseyi]|nr:hypothetical protein M3Y96_00987700 [Aphelenchoides besseyi]